MKKIIKSTQQWKTQLDSEQYRVTREAGTEAPFSGLYCDHSEDGFYQCVCCDHPLFNSQSKYHSGCGWPSFHGELDTAEVIQRPDHGHGMSRIELLCPAVRLTWDIFLMMDRHRPASVIALIRPP
jgi:peptide-methionine (R)-S-oxide reductase